MEAVSASDDDAAWIAVEESSASGQARRVAVALAGRIGFSEHRAGEVGIVATELATNLHRHAAEGMMLVRVRRVGDVPALDLLAVDNGPGMSDLALRMQDGHSSRGTLGIGLGSAVRLASRFDAHSIFGRGTVMFATFVALAATDAGGSDAAVLTRPIDGEIVSGDGVAVRTDGGAVVMIAADGLGHGELAAMASREALRIFASADAGEPLPALLGRVDRALRSTRGAAVAIVRFEPATRELSFVGIGNVAAWIDDVGKRRGFASTPGIVGTHAKPAREVRAVVPSDALVVLHSDGLTPKWNLDEYPGVRTCDPHVIAGTLLRDAGIRHDDASIAVLKT